jgi:hypothetical protein
MLLLSTVLVFFVQQFTFFKLSAAIRVADPGSVAFWPLDPGSGMSKKSGSGMNNTDHISESLETIFGLKYLNSLMRIRDGKYLNPGTRIEKIRIRDLG